MSTAQTIDFHSTTETPPAIHLPVPEQIFARRRRRFETLAPKHSLGDWLAYLGLLTAAQDRLIGTLGETLAVDADFVAQAYEHEMPPLNALSYPRPALWIDLTRCLARELADVSPAPLQSPLKVLESADADALEAMADALFDGRLNPDALAETTLVAASLQILWTALAARLNRHRLKVIAPSGLCPCCGSLPVSSLLKTSAQINNLRYLHCSLCNTEWNVTRATCTSCGKDGAVAYRQIDGNNGAIRAECCDHCFSYLKILAQEKDPDVDPVADDLATLTLDLLVDELGYSRSGPNLLLLGGAG